MTAVEGLPKSRPSRDDAAGTPRIDGLPVICPYLATADGSWRSANAVRDHRCTAVSPAVPLALEKQRRLCLDAAHEDCATYLAAEAARAAARERYPAPSRPIARMTPLILDQTRFDVRLPALRADRVSGQAVLVAVLGVAFGALLLARPLGDAGASGGAGPSAVASVEPSLAAPSGAPSVLPSTEPSTPAPTAEATPTTEPTEAPATTTPAPATPSPEPSTSGETYRVRSGDTLVAIAARFGTTTRVLIELNGIEDPSKLRIGQILKLP
jgi:LysM repeat protein